MDTYIIHTIFLMESDSDEGDAAIIISLQNVDYKLLMASILGFIGIVQIGRSAFNKCRDRFWTKFSKSKTTSPQAGDKKDSDVVPPQRKKTRFPIWSLTTFLGFFQRKLTTTKPQDCIELIPEPSMERYKKENTEIGLGMHPDAMDDMNRKARKDVPVDMYRSRSVTVASCSHSRAKQVGFSQSCDLSMSLDARKHDKAGFSTSEHQKQHFIEKGSSPIYIDMFNDVTCLKTSQRKSVTLKASRNKTNRLAAVIRKLSRTCNQNKLTEDRLLSPISNSNVNLILRKNNHVPERRESFMISKPADRGTVGEIKHNPSSKGFGVENNPGHLLPSDISPPRLGQRTQLLNSLLVTQAKKQPIPCGCKDGPFDAQYTCPGSDIYLATKPHRCHVLNKIENSPSLSASVRRFNFSRIRPWQKYEVRDSCTNDESNFLSSCDACHFDYNMSEQNGASNTTLSTSFSTSPRYHYFQDGSVRVNQGDHFKMATTRPNEEKRYAVPHQIPDSQSMVREMSKAQETNATRFAAIQTKTPHTITARLQADIESKRPVKSDNKCNPHFFAYIKKRFETNKKSASKIPCLVQRRENKNIDLYTVKKKAQDKGIRTNLAANQGKTSLKNAYHSNAINTQICDDSDLQHNFGRIEPYTNIMDRPGKKPATDEKGINTTTSRRTTIDSRRKHVNSRKFQEVLTLHKPICSYTTAIGRMSFIPVPVSKPIVSRQTAKNVNKTNGSIREHKCEILSEEIAEVKDTTGNVKNITNLRTLPRGNDMNVSSNIFQNTQTNLYNSFISVQTTTNPKAFHDKKEANQQMSSKSVVSNSSSLATSSSMGLPKVVERSGYFGDIRTCKSTSQNSNDGYPIHKNQGNSKTLIETIGNEERPLSPVKWNTMPENRMKKKLPSSSGLGKANNCGLSQEDTDSTRHVMKTTLQSVPSRVTKANQGYVNTPESKENKQIYKSITLKSEVSNIAKSKQKIKFSKLIDFIDTSERTFLKNHNDMQPYSITNQRHLQSSDKINPSISSDQETNNTSSLLNHNVGALRKRFDKIDLKGSIGISGYSYAQNNEVKYEKSLPAEEKEKDISILQCQRLHTGRDNLGSVLDDLANIESLEPEKAEQFYLPQQLPNLIVTTSEDSSGGSNTFKRQTKECLNVPSCGYNETANATNTRTIRPIHPNQLKIYLCHKSLTRSKVKKSYGQFSKETQRSNKMLDSSPRDSICEHGATYINETSGPDFADAKEKPFQACCCELHDLGVESQIKAFQGDRHGINKSTFYPDRKITVTDVVPDYKSQSQLQSYSTTAFETPNFYSVFSAKDKLEEWAKTNIPSHEYSTLHHGSFGEDDYASGCASGIKSGHEKVNDNTYELPRTHLESKLLNKIEGFSLNSNKKSFKIPSSDITTSWIADHKRNTCLCVAPRRGNKRSLPCNLPHTVGSVKTKVISSTTDTSIPTGSIVSPGGFCNEKSIRKNSHDLHSVTTDVDNDVSEQCPRSSSCEGDNNIMSLDMTKSRSRNEKLFSERHGMYTGKPKTSEILRVMPTRKRRHSPPKLFNYAKSALSYTKLNEVCTGGDDHKPELLNQQLQMIYGELLHSEFSTSTSKTNLPKEVMKNNNNIPTSLTLQTRIELVKNHQTRAAIIDLDPLSNGQLGTCVDNTSNDVSSGEFGSSLGEVENVRVRSGYSDAGETYNQSKSKRILLDWYKPSYQTTTYRTSEDAENGMDEQQVDGLESTNIDDAPSNQGISRSTNCNENDTCDLEECCCYPGLGRFHSHADTINTYLNQNKMVDPNQNLNHSINNRHEVKYRSDDTDDDYYCHCNRNLGSGGVADVQTGSSVTSDRGDESSSPEDSFVCYSSSDISQKVQCTQTTPLYDISSF